MKKIISLFQRNYETDRLVRNEVVLGAEWVLAGEGEATRKLDGTCCMIRAGRLYKRYDLPLLPEWDRKKKKENYKGPWLDSMYKKPPVEWEKAEDTPDENTGHWPGWLPVGEGPEDKWHRKAFEGSIFPDGTYELCGPHIQGNPEHFENDNLTLHGVYKLPDAPRSFYELREYFRINDIEGIVWHHPDGRMVKIKKKDFGLRRGIDKK